MVDLNELTEHLQSIPLFSALDTSRLKLLAFTSERVIFREGELICRQGESGDAAFIMFL